MWGATSSWFSSIQSPKSLLASKLAASLASHFDVDPAAIESCLVNDAKIVLRNIQLKPQCVGDALLVGAVESIEFSWKWGGSADGSTSFVRETVLSIRGARFRLIAKAAPASPTNPVVPQDSSQGNQNAAVPSGFMDTYVQQIIDHLTLNITDVEFAVETLDEAQGKLIVEAKSVQLLSLGRLTGAKASSAGAEPAPPLSQRLSVGLLRAYVVDGEKEFALLDPFAYASLVRRVSGRRFQGLAYGLDVTGDIGDDKDHENRLIIHAGSTQVAVLSKIFDDFLDDPNFAADASAETSPVVQQEQLSQEPEADSESRSTAFELPFPSLVLCLPNGAKIQMPRCTFQYYMDGSAFRLTGADGIRINDHQAPFLQLAKDVKWSMDFVTSTFSVGFKDELCADHMQQKLIGESLTEKAVAHVEWDEEHMKLVIKGLLDLEGSSAAVVAKGMDACTTSDSSNISSSPWSFSVQGNVSVLMTGQRDEWIKGCVRSIAFALSSDLSSGCILSEFEIAGAQLGPTSFGDGTIDVPATVLNSETSLLSVKAPVHVQFDSVSSIEKIQGFMAAAMDIDFGSLANPASRDSVTLLPVGAYIPRVHFVFAEPMQMTAQLESIQVSRSCTVDIESLRCESNDGLGGSVLGLSIANCQELEMRIDRIEFLHLPGIMNLGDPIEGAKLRLNNGTLEIEFESIHAVLAEPRETSTGVAKTATASSPPAPSVTLLPCAVSFRAGEISLTLPTSDKEASSASIQLRSIGVVLEPANDGSFSVTSQMSTYVRVLGKDEHWLEAQLDPALVVLSSDFVIRQAKCSGIRIGPASVGHVALTVPSFEMLSEKSGLRFDDAIDISLDSHEALLPLQGLVNSVIEASQCYSSGGLPAAAAAAATAHDPLCLPFGVVASKIRMIMIEPSVELNLFDIQTTAGRAKVSCAHLALNGPDGMSASVARIEATLEPDLKATFESIKTLHIPGVCSLREPVRDSSFSFSSDCGLGVGIGSVALILLDQTPAASTSSSTPVLPFPIHLRFEELAYDTSPGANDSTLIRRLELSAKPSASNLESTQFCLNVSCLENKMIKAQQVSVSGVYGGTANTISDLKAKLDSATVSAGFSSVEWKQVLKPKKPKPGDKQKVIWMLPSAHVAAFSTNVSYKGKVMSTTAAISLREFIGDANTKLDDIMKHFTSGALRQIPSFFSNAEVLGGSVANMGATNVGRMVFKSSLGGSITGSVGGLVVSDGIRGAIASGKKARGAPDDGKYHFGDFTKGSVRALQETSKKGGSMRELDSQSYQVGDFSRGASTSSGKYVADNKQRLGAAAGSSVGMMVGAVALGPIGLIAGSIIGARAASNAFSDKKKQHSTDEGSPPQAAANMTGRRDGDLLGLEGASMPERAAPVLQARSTIDPFAPATQPLNPPKARDNLIASVSQPTLHPLQTGGGVADPFATALQVSESQSGIGSTVDQLTPQQQQSVSNRPNMHQAADPFQAIAPLSTPREVDVSDDDPFGLTAQSSRATAGSHAMNANYSPMSHTQPTSNSEQNPPFSARNNDGKHNTGAPYHQSGMHVGVRQKAPPTPMYSNHQDFLDGNSPYAPPQQSVSNRPNMHHAADPFAAVAPISTPREVDVSDNDPFGLTAQSSRATTGSNAINANHSPMSHAQPRSNSEQYPSFSAPNNDGNHYTGGFKGHPQQSGMHVGVPQKAPPTQIYSNHQDLPDPHSPYAPPNNMNPSRQPVTPQMETGGEWGHSQNQPQPPQSQHDQQRRATPAQPQVDKKEGTGYRFGDATRSIVAEGKKKSGRSEKDGYKFGDFTRGFFGS